MNKPCVRTLIAVRKVQRHPLTKKTLLTVKKHMIRDVALGVLPSGINDFVFHHAQITPNEITHIVSDQISISTIITLMVMVVKMKM